MLSKVHSYTKRMLRIKRPFLNNSYITDLLSIFVITFAIVLILNGIILMTTTPAQDNSKGVTSQFAVAVVNSIPGIPFTIADLSQYSLSEIGLVSWIIGLNFLLIGLGLWVKHKFARMIGLIVFGLASFFQATQFLLLGLVGSPISIIEMALNILIAYLLFSKFEVKLTNPMNKESPDAIVTK
jgi:hypothetical protein